MAMSPDVKRKIFELLPEEYVAEAPFVEGRYKPPGATHKQNAQWWSQQDDGFLFFALHEDFIQLDLTTIKKIAIVTSTQLDREDDEYPEDQQNAVLDTITCHVNSETLRQITEGTWGGHDQSQQISNESIDERITADELWLESERIAQPVMLLKNRKSKSTTTKPVAVWNSSLASVWQAGPWIRVDMRFHPNDKLRADGVLVVHVDHRKAGVTTRRFRKRSAGRDSVGFAAPGKVIHVELLGRIFTATWKYAVDAGHSREAALISSKRSSSGLSIVSPFQVSGLMVPSLVPRNCK